MFNKEQLKVIALSSLGGGLEFFDFIVFVYLAKTISQLFFPTTDPTVSLMATFAVFAVGYLARPLGGIFFGHLGDRHGRKKSFILSVSLMALPTFLIGLLPTYATAGIYAAGALVILRLLQGFSLGGEIPGATVFVLETVTPRYRGFAIGLIFLGINAGFLIGSLLVALLTHYLSSAQLHVWGWRIPFLIGGIFGVISFYLRKRLQETPVFQAIAKNQLHGVPLKIVLQYHLQPILRGISIVALEAVIVGMVYLYLPTYLATYFHFALAPLLLLNTIALSLFTIPILLASFISDNVGRKKMILFSAVAYLLLSYFLFHLFTYQSWPLLITALVLLTLLASPLAGCFACMTAELFPTRVRFSGMAFAYNIGFGVIGGLTPLFATYLIHTTKNLLAPSFLLMFIAALAVFALIFTKETAVKSLVEE